VFFGWEYLLAKKVGDPQRWIDSNQSYGIREEDGAFNEFGNLTSKKQMRLIAERIKVGKELGIISKNNKPRPWRE